MEITSQFTTNGICFPVPILNKDEVAYYSTQLIRYLQDIEWKLTPSNRHKPHIRFAWAEELGKHPKIIESIKPILGENLLLWYSVIFVKPPRSDKYIPWHQDSTYWALKNHDEGLTVWLALCEVDKNNGSMSYLPGSHREVIFGSHKVETDKNNILARGQKILNIDSDKEEFVTLSPGEASIHHNLLLHRSAPNQSNEARLGIAFRYIKPDNSPMTLRWLKRSATLVSGVDNHCHFARDPSPASDNKFRCRIGYIKSLLIAFLHTLAGDNIRNVKSKIKDSIPTLISNMG